MAGQLGIDEGGILQALAKGGGRQIHESFVYNKKGLLIDKTTTTLEVTGAHVVFALIAAGILVAGPAVAEELSDPTTFPGPNVFTALAAIKKLWNKVV